MIIGVVDRMSLGASNEPLIPFVPFLNSEPYANTFNPVVSTAAAIAAFS